MTGSVDELRTELRRREASLRERFEAGAPASELVAARAAVVDDLLKAAWERFGLGPDLGLVAVGGYGRSELHPGSDVDLLVLVDRRRAGRLRRRNGDRRLESFITALWDLGLEVGHAVRTPRQCAEEARRDLTVVTNLVEARPVVGSSELFEAMRDAVAPKRMWSASEFFRAKEREQRERHLRYRESGYDLEPNVKEGPGGLRDIHTIAWVARRHFGGRARTEPGLRDLFDHGFLTEEEFRALREGQGFLWQVRTTLHYLAGRREDRLLFDRQIALAERFGYRDADHNLGVELFMKRYYRAIQSLRRLNEMLLQHFREHIINRHRLARTRKINPINQRFRSRGGQLEVNDASVFERYPFALLELFVLLQRHPDIDGVRAATIRLVRRHLHLVDDAFRADLTCRSLFLEMFRQPHGLSRALRRMHTYGILGRYLPAFGQVTGLMQFDLFHVYTVDEHLLRTVASLRRFALPEHRDELPDCADLFATLPRPELLYLAGLFHDIAKGRGSDHSEGGAREAAEFCEQHGISRFDAGLVIWLVRHHLVMSTTAQREDISDPVVIRRFAERVGDETRLDYLYLLTVGDIRATNPGLWTDWKYALLRDLYQSTRSLLLHGLDSPAPATTELIRACRDEARRRLVESDLATSAVEDLWETLEPAYFVLTAPDAVAWHAEVVLRAATRPLVAVRSERGRTEVFVHERDREHLFAAATTVLERLGLTVLDARVFTSKAGLSFDSFTVAEADGGPIDLPVRQEEIRRALARGLGDPEGSRYPTSRLPRRQIKSFDIPVRVTFDAMPRHGRTVMEVVCADRPGVLSRIGWALAGTGTSVHGAKIATVGERVEDVFRLSDRNGEPLDEERQSNLRARIERALETRSQPPVTGGKKATSSPSRTR